MATLGAAGDAPAGNSGGGAARDARINPLAPQELSGEILQIVEQAARYKQLKKGTNEAVKTLTRELAEFIVIAADAKPIEIVMHLPLVCEDKNVPYVFVASKESLGRACGVSRPVIACSVLKADVSGAASPLKNQLRTLRVKIENLML